LVNKLALGSKLKAQSKQLTSKNPAPEKERGLLLGDTGIGKHLAATIVAGENP
jgi:ribose 5-phosphate isomerase RpiB